MNTYGQVRQTTTNDMVQSYVTHVFMLMGIGLGLTALVASFTFSSPVLFAFAIKFRFILFIAEIGMVFYLASRVTRMSPNKALIIFLGYSALNGVTLSPIFYVYTKTAITQAFGISAGMFAFMALWGLTTKKDLTSLGSLCYMGLFGIILASVFNLFFGNSGFQLIISYVSVGVFIGLTAWDAQKIKGYALAGEMKKNLAVLGALQLYLDFINLFIHILYILGGRRN